MRRTSQPASRHAASFRASSPASWCYGPPSISMMRRSPRPAQVRLLAGDVDVEARKLDAGVAQDLQGPHFRAASRSLDRKPAVPSHRRSEADCAAAVASPAEPVTQRVDRQASSSRTNSRRAFARARSLTQQARSRRVLRGRRDRDPVVDRRLARQGRAAIDRDAAHPPRATAAGSHHGDATRLKSRGRPTRMLRSLATEERLGGSERRAHPSAPVVVLEHGRDRKDSFGDDHEPPRRDAVLDRRHARPARSAAAATCD